MIVHDVLAEFTRARICKLTLRVHAHDINVHPARVVLATALENCRSFGVILILKPASHGSRISIETKRGDVQVVETLGNYLGAAGENRSVAESQFVVEIVIVGVRLSLREKRINRINRVHFGSLSVGIALRP